MNVCTDKKVSIVVPVYNSEKYLGYCINSILSQTYTNIELILVNDGSQDKSINICNNYALIDPRVKVIDIPNSGVSHARNIGIDEVYQINLFAIGDVFPDTTIFFDIPYEIGLERINKNHRDTDRLDLESNDFHKKVYEGYMSICEKYADRITKIDASKSIDEVASQVIDIIKKII